ncbi:unnamed protein product [Lepidochelys olivacea]
MTERGDDRDTRQFRMKVKELRNAEHRAREANRHSGAVPMSCRFSKELDRILRGDPTSIANTTVDTSVARMSVESGPSQEEEILDEDVEGDPEAEDDSEVRDACGQELFSTPDVGEAQRGEEAPAMAEEVRKVPLKPIRAWEETRPPRRKSPRKSPQQQQELCVPQPFHADSPSPGNASCFMGPDWQEKDTLDYINTFLKGNEQGHTQLQKDTDPEISSGKTQLKGLVPVLWCPPPLEYGPKGFMTFAPSLDVERGGVEEFRVLGQLVGCLTLCSAEQEQEICQSAMEGLHHLYAFMLWQKRTTLAKQSAEYLQVFREWRAENSFWVTWFTNTSNIAMMFGKYFNPSERLDFLLTAIEGMRDTSVHDSVAARDMLHVILWVPSPSLERVSDAVMSVYRNLDSISEPLAQQQLLKALVVLGDQYSEEVVTTLLGCLLSCDSIAVEMWRVLTSHPKTAGKVLRELLDRLQERPLRQHHDISQQEAGVAPLAVGKLQHQLPVVVEQLHGADRDVISNAITVLRDILAGMDRQSTSPVAVQVAEKLLPFFHDESSKLRVLSITLFKHLLELVRGPSRRKMKEHVVRSLVPLLLLLHDERPNVSQVCWDTLRSALEFLRWSQLSALVQKKELWRDCDCLVACYKGRAETFLCQAMAFVENPQAPIREAAIRFLGLTARQLDQQSQEKLEAICNVLKGLQQDSKSSVRCLALQTTLILKACKKHRPARASLRTLLHRMRLMHTRENPVIEAAQLRK